MAPVAEDYGRMDERDEHPRGPTVSVVRERSPGERRVALTPASVSRLVARGLAVVVEAGAGSLAYYPDDAYAAAGASLSADALAVRAAADVLVAVRPPLDPDGQSPASGLRPGATVIGLLAPDENAAFVEVMAREGLTGLSLDLAPARPGARRFDARASQGTVAGYRAALLAAVHCPHLFPMMILPAGRLAPARVLVIGVGVVGLQAIVTAKRLGAIVEAYDTRSHLREQVESLGASFVLPAVEAATEGYRDTPAETARRQQETVAELVVRADAVVTTAAVPGRPAPILIPEETVAAMRPGAVIVDASAGSGGNCELTVPGETVTRHGVTVVGATDLASDLPGPASALLSRNIEHLLALVVGPNGANVDPADPLVGPACVTLGGEIYHEPTRARLGLSPLRPAPPRTDETPDAVTEGPDGEAPSAPTSSEGDRGPGDDGRPSARGDDPDERSTTPLFVEAAHDADVSRHAEPLDAPARDFGEAAAADEAGSPPRTGDARPATVVSTSTDVAPERTPLPRTDTATEGPEPPLTTRPALIVSDGEAPPAREPDQTHRDTDRSHLSAAEGESESPSPVVERRYVTATDVGPVGSPPSVDQEGEATTICWQGSNPVGHDEGDAADGRGRIDSSSLGGPPETWWSARPAAGASPMPGETATEPDLAPTAVFPTLSPPSVSPSGTTTSPLEDRSAVAWRPPADEWGAWDEEDPADERGTAVDPVERASGPTAGFSAAVGPAAEGSSAAIVFGSAGPPTDRSDPGQGGSDASSADAHDSPWLGTTSPLDGHVLTAPPSTPTTQAEPSGDPSLGMVPPAGTEPAEVPVAQSPQPGPSAAFADPAMGPSDTTMPLAPAQTSDVGQRPTFRPPWRRRPAGPPDGG